MVARERLVSVVIPTYNRAPLLGRTLESVLAQEHRPLEVVVVDDASEDDTRSVLLAERRRFARAGATLRIQVLDRNSGSAVARNTALGLCSGSYVAFLDSDDVWHPRFLSTVVDVLDRHPDCAVAFSGHLGIDIDGRLVPRDEPEALGPGREGVLRTPFEQFMRTFPFTTTSTLVRRRVFDEVGTFDETLRLWQDADLWLRIAKRFDFAYTTEPLAYYRLHEGNITNRRLEWYRHQLRVTLRHLDDVVDPSTRAFAVEQVRRAQVLLQEELLRAGDRAPLPRALLYNDVTPASLRFRVGHLMMLAPRWLQRTYASAIRDAGDARRRLQRTPTTKAAGAWQGLPVPAGASQGPRFAPRHFPLLFLRPGGGLSLSTVVLLLALVVSLGSGGGFEPLDLD
jgi:glycosyltransferase involved in cell wall biosynthesis